MERLARYSLLLIIFLSCAGYCLAQDEKRPNQEIITDRPSPEYDPTSWKEFSSKEGKFTVLFPGKPTEKSQTVDSPFGKLDAHMFLLETFAYYSIVYVDYPATDGIRDAEAYFNGVRDGNLKATNGQLLEEKKDYHLAVPGRYFKTRLPNGIINRINIYFAQYRSYIISIAMLEMKADAESLKFYEGVATKFLSSFKLAPAQTNPNDRFGDPKGAKSPTLSTGAGVNLDPVSSKSLDFSRDGKPMPAVQVNAGVLNGKATSLPKPIYSMEAELARAKGEVKVQVVFDEEGNVIWARALSGHPLLQVAAEAAAYRAKFPPIAIQGRPVKVSGFLVYKFVK